MKRLLAVVLLVAVAVPAFAEGQGEVKKDEDNGNKGRHGLVAHYYRDPVEWDGNWKAGSKPQVDPADWTFTAYSHSQVEPLVNHLFIRRGWFSVRWQGVLNVPADGPVDVTFELWADDGCRLKIDGKSVIDDWRDVSEDATDSHRSAMVNLAPGAHKIVIEYFQGESLRRDDKDPIKLYWTIAGKSGQKSIVPASAFTYTEEDLFPEPGRDDPKGEEFLELVLEKAKKKVGDGQDK